MLTRAETVQFSFVLSLLLLQVTGDKPEKIQLVKRNCNGIRKAHIEQAKELTISI